MKGPLQVDLTLQQTVCPIGLFIGQEDDESSGIKTDKICAFVGGKNWYPYDTCLNDDFTVEKYDESKNDASQLDKLLSNLKGLNPRKIRRYQVNLK